MKFKMLVKSVGTDREPWWEEYDKPGKAADAQKIGQSIIDFWNETLSEHETARALLEVRVIDEREDTSEHQWEKQNSFTQQGKRRSRGINWDVMKCKSCGITGKRYGLGSYVARDGGFKRELFADCRKAKEYLQKRA